jgi:NitT/TauT family transport system substrate-binding protein
MPKDYYTGDKDLYVKALADGKVMFTADGVMPDQGPETVLKVLSLSNKALESKKIDLSKTYTSEFVKAAK